MYISFINIIFDKIFHIIFNFFSSLIILCSAILVGMIVKSKKWITEKLGY